jgi:hypothetical protein
MVEAPLPPPSIVLKADDLRFITSAEATNALLAEVMGAEPTDMVATFARFLRDGTRAEIANQLVGAPLVPTDDPVDLNPGEYTIRGIPRGSFIVEYHADGVVVPLKYACGLAFSLIMIRRAGALTAKAMMHLIEVDGHGIFPLFVTTGPIRTTVNGRYDDVPAVFTALDTDGKYHHEAGVSTTAVFVSMNRRPAWRATARARGGLTGYDALLRPQSPEDP